MIAELDECHTQQVSGCKEINNVTTTNSLQDHSLAVTSISPVATVAKKRIIRKGYVVVAGLGLVHYNVKRILQVEDINLREGDYYRNLNKCKNNAKKPKEKSERAKFVELFKNACRETYILQNGGIGSTNSYNFVVTDLENSNSPDLPILLEYLPSTRTIERDFKSQGFYLINQPKHRRPHNKPLGTKLGISSGVNVALPCLVKSSDITYIKSVVIDPNGKKRVINRYVAFVNEHFDNGIDSKQVGETQTADLVTVPTAQALSMYYPISFSPIYLSDHGRQYQSHALKDLLKDFNALPACTRIGSCIDNGISERTNGQFKQYLRSRGLVIDTNSDEYKELIAHDKDNERGDSEIFRIYSLEELEYYSDEFMLEYNFQRPQSACGGIAPFERRAMFYSAITGKKEVTLLAQGRKGQKVAVNIEVGKSFFKSIPCDLRSLIDNENAPNLLRNAIAERMKYDLIPISDKESTKLAEQLAEIHAQGVAMIDAGELNMPRKKYCRKDLEYLHLSLENDLDSIKDILARSYHKLYLRIYATQDNSDQFKKATALAELDDMKLKQANISCLNDLLMFIDSDQGEDVKGLLAAKRIELVNKLS